MYPPRYFLLASNHVSKLTLQQVNHILNFRNQELVSNNGLHLSQIAETNQKDSRIMVDIAQSSSRDSQTTRIATLIAMMYLPASLILVS